MSVEGNREILRRWVAGLEGNIDDAVQVLAPDFMGHFTASPQPVAGPEMFKQGFLYFIKPSFPDQRFTIEREVVTDDTIAIHMTWTATHQGAWNGIPATGKRVTCTGTGIFRIRDGKVAEEWMQEDFAGVAQQLTGAA